ncbi:hypothetical protein [Nocardia sp. IFM 10818]
MTEPVARSPQLIRNFKRARRIPMLIGRTHTGERIPGGPYSPLQFLGTGAVVGLLILTYPAWSRFGSSAQNIAVFVGLPAATLWLLGRLPQAGRNPVSIAVGALKALTSTVTTPTVNGRPVRAPRAPQALTGTVTISAAPRPAAPTVTAQPVPRGLGSAALLSATSRRAA